jgi:hypothetical protein
MSEHYKTNAERSSTDRGPNLNTEIIHTLKRLHEYQVQNNETFGSKHLKAHHSAMLSKLERLKIRWVHALHQSGIDPKCHGQFSYGSTVEERASAFVKIVKSIFKTHGATSLNDNTMNAGEKIDVPEELWDTAFRVSYEECSRLGCKPIRLTRRSIYATGRRLFGSWATALSSAGIDLDEVQRKPASLDFLSIVKDLNEYDDQTGSDWTITKIRKERSNLERAIYNLKIRKKVSIPYHAASDDIVFVVWVNMIYWREKGVISEDLIWYERNSDQLIERFKEQHRGQEQWDENSIVLGIQDIYGRGASDLRLSREDVSNRGREADKTLWSAMRQRRFLDAGKNEEAWFKQSGILIHKLRAKYKQLDERYSVEDCMNYFSNLMKDSLALGENRLTREFNEIADGDFTNFIINKYGSWEAGLTDHGLDPKFFSITSSKRTKRGYRFQKFVEEQFEVAGLKPVTKDPKDKEFVANKSIKICDHDVKCKPDFLFSSLIIDTKTGYHASQKPDQLLRYFDHVPNVLILTLNDSEHTVMLKGRPIRVIGFSTFLEKSEALIGVKLDVGLKSELSEILKQHPFWA